MVKIVYPNEEEILNNNFNNQIVHSVFLAGTIDNGNSKNWQKEVIEEFRNINLPYNLDIFNPRVKEWNPNSTTKDIEFQIKWEQEHLDKADLICMVLSDNSKSPISLLEMGLYAHSGKLIVFCTDKFYRYDNVRLTCEKYNIHLVNYTNSKYIVNQIQKSFN